jgi:hypothetical protein
LDLTGGKWQEAGEDSLNEELHNLYTLPNIIRVIKSRRLRWVGHVACMAEMRNTYIILVGKPAGKRSLRRPGGG